MVKPAFLMTCGFILGALLVQYKQYLFHNIPNPTAILPDGGVYEGELQRGLLGGQGRVAWPDGAYYEGSFDEGMFSGKGLLHTPDFLYEGDFQVGQATGEAVITFSNGNKYEGQVKFGLPDGYGVMETPQGDVYKGSFKDGHYEGQGEMTTAKGDTYVGSFEQSLFHGQGVYTRLEVAAQKGENEENDKVIYSGTFSKGQFTGEGVWIDGENRYEGQFLNWAFHGDGLYSDSNGVYTGKFAQGVYEGKGVFVGVDDLRYEGGFSGGRYNGQGILTDTFGNVYTGGFLHGVKHGKGKLVYQEPLDGLDELKGEWALGKLIKSTPPEFAVPDTTVVEHVLYQQSDMLDAALTKVVDQDQEKTELYFVGIAGDGSEGVFRRELDYVKTLFDKDYGTANKSIALINSHLTYKTQPLATVTSIQRTLENVASKMDKDNDILFVFMTSHGHEDFKLHLEQPGLNMESLSAETLSKMLKPLPVKHKVVVISACYSGGFIPKIKDDFMMIITASEADKTSFGCSDLATMTYFGEAFFKDAVPQSESFIDAFDRARDIVRGREAKEGFENSNPLIFKPKAIEAKLKQWREQLAEDAANEPLPITPTTIVPPQ